MGYLIGFAPWIVYWILVGNTGFVHAVAIALGIAIAGPIVQRMRGGRLHTLDIGTGVVFAVLLVLAFALSDAVLERWLQPISNSGLFLITVAGLALGRPFVREYAEEQVDQQTAASDGFRVITVAMTWMWAGAFGVMTLSSLIPPIVDGEATIRDEGHLLSVVCYWVVPYTVLGIAGLASGLFPSWFEKQSERVSARVTEPEVRAQPLAPPDRADENLRLDLPGTSRHDEPLSLVVSGNRAGSRVDIRSSGFDITGREWSATASFVMPDSGILEIAAQRPAAGDWQEADGDAIVWAMRPAVGETAPEIFVPPGQDWRVTVEAVCGEAVSRRTVSRRGTADSVTVTTVDVDGRPGLMALPAGAPPPGGWPAVVCFGGSEGGYDSQRQTIMMLASRGFAALAYSWIDAGAPVSRVPLERFAAAANWLAARNDVSEKLLAALAISRGAEGLLAAAAETTLDVHAIVLLSPSAVSWQAVGPDGEIPGTPSWSLFGEDFAFAPLPTGSLMPQLIRNAWRVNRDIAAGRPTLLRLRPAYETGLVDPPVEAALQAEKVRCPLLCISGAEDALWPSTVMAEQLMSRRGNRPGDSRIEFQGAGHFFRFGIFPTDALWTGGIVLGGERSAHAAAERQATEHVTRFLSASLRTADSGQ
ncbi:acyl-CoA thioesterase/BAAT N-terminal domain-containing protein [Hoyosella sp. YIM 151337]|uniref:acyl-CoA thioester hydrolase/BAAT C-terminal domain-containing protein n=1 Tax=Hoyosella sp. YIM 151337 TaxID=2992742 RepID=UPI0022356B2E|nr:acyl-CoA thioester hydrolase/BAAT C-terminal domain-containing protein [Hoyosella sp. YIM 151337]MCW4352361.1 acyl-CoA thioesterase/BAAT N-terminal domain-containing protein [Hoyosella sp. YIM 151337]